MMMTDTEKPRLTPSDIETVDAQARLCANRWGETEKACPYGTDNPLRRARWLKTFRAIHRRARL